MVSAFGLQEFAFAMQQQDTTKKEKKVHSNPATPFRLLYIDIVEVNYQDNTPRFGAQQ